MDQVKERNERALTRHIAHTERAQDALAVIKLYLDDHGEVAPDDVDWGNVGDMARVADDLQAIVRYIRS